MKKTLARLLVVTVVISAIAPANQAFASAPTEYVQRILGACSTNQKIAAFLGMAVLVAGVAWKKLSGHKAAQSAPQPLSAYKNLDIRKIVAAARAIDPRKSLDECLDKIKILMELEELVAAGVNITKNHGQLEDGLTVLEKIAEKGYENVTVFYRYESDNYRNNAERNIGVISRWVNEQVARASGPQRTALQQRLNAIEPELFGARVYPCMSAQ